MEGGKSVWEHVIGRRYLGVRLHSLLIYWWGHQDVWSQSRVWNVADFLRGKRIDFFFFFEDLFCLLGIIVKTDGQFMELFLRLEEPCQREIAWIKGKEVKKTFSRNYLVIFNPMSSFKSHCNYCSLVCYFYLFAFNCQDKHTQTSSSVVSLWEVSPAGWTNTKFLFTLHHLNSFRLENYCCFSFPSRHQESLNRDCVLLAE